MSDFSKAVENIGNHFDFVLVASERVREINRARRIKSELLDMPQKGSEKVTSSSQAFSDIESGVVGREYLNRLGAITRRKKTRIN